MSPCVYDLMLRQKETIMYVTMDYKNMGVLVNMGKADAALSAVVGSTFGGEVHSERNFRERFLEVFVAMWFSGFPW